MKYSIYNKQVEKAKVKIGLLMEEIEEGGKMLCPICCEVMNSEDFVVYMPCNIRHFYHSECISVWLRKNDNCPLCKTLVLTNQEEI
jgi:hypothetical protein